MTRTAIVSLSLLLGLSLYASENPSDDTQLPFTIIVEQVSVSPENLPAPVLLENASSMGSQDSEAEEDTQEREALRAAVRIVLPHWQPGEGKQAMPTPLSSPKHTATPLATLLHQAPTKEEGTHK